MWRKIFKPLPDGDYDLRERMLRSLIQFGGAAALMGMIEMSFMVEETKVMLPIWAGILLAIGATLVVTFKYRKYEAATMILGFVIVILIFPFMFCMSGGIDSGCSIWLTLGLLYMFILFRGKKRVVFVLMTLTSYAVVYYAAYKNPEILVPMSSEKAVYIDSFFSLTVVAFIAGTIYQMHMKAFENERKVNLAQKEELERSSLSKNAFFANMSHEIRTPINAIMGLNEMIIRSNPSKEVLEYTQDIQTASNILLNHVNDILDFSQMEVNKMHLVPVTYQVKDTFLNLIELIRVQTNKKNLDLFVDIDKNLPSVLEGDEKRLKQVLLNVLDNAVKYTEEGSITLSITGEEYKNNTIKLKIKVADTGIGIRKENLEGIYDAFNRYDEARNKRILGTGLGLAITKQLVDMMDGEILVDSIYRKGTVFTITVIQKVVNAESIGDIEYLERSVEERPEYKPLFVAPEARILIVDDSNMNRMVAARLITATNVQIDTAASGTECLEMTKQKYYHVILLDYLMPDMDGAQTMHAVRTQENGLCRDSAIIALTGNTVSGAREMYLEQGFDSYVEKPIQGRRLEEELLSFIPNDIVEYRETEAVSVSAETAGQMQRMSQRKRKRIYITTDCTCDIPQELLEKYDIKLMYLYIKTPNGRFADTREIDSDSIAQYLSLDKTEAYGDKVSVEEFEEFFAEALLEAEEVIHISLASKVGRSHGVAVEAAKGFDHVRVIDSGQISCGQGLVVLYAAQLMSQGKTVSEICTAVENMKNHVHTSFIMPGADIFYQTGRTSAFVAKICRMFQLHPFAGFKQKKIVLYALLFGALEKAWRHGIAFSFRNRRKINTDIVFITHVGCSVKQQEWIKKEISKHVPFDKVLVNKTSFTTACSVGMGTIGYAYYTVPKENKKI